MARIEGVRDRILSCAGPRSVDNYVASETGEGAYRPAATASCERVGDATLACGGGSFLRRVRGPFRLGVCRSRDFHRSSLTRRADKARTRELAYDARRPGMWGRSPRTSMPERFVAPARSGPVLSVRREMSRRRWGRVEHTTAAPSLRDGQAVTFGESTGRSFFNQKNKARRRRMGHKKTPAHYRASPIRRRKKEDEA